MGEKHQRRWWPKQEEDNFAAAELEAMAVARSSEPPERRKPSAAGKWLRRGKLWDDVFTRLVANLVAASIIAVVAATAGLIHFDRTAWAAVIFWAGLVVNIVVVNVQPVRYLKRQWLRWVVFGVIFFGFGAVAFWVSPYEPSSRTGTECVDVFGC